MNDIDHLLWIYARLVKVHKEDPRVDYMRQMRMIIEEYTRQKLEREFEEIVIEK